MSSKEDIASKMAINIHAKSKKSHINLKELHVYELKSIWAKDESFRIATPK